MNLVDTQKKPEALELFINDEETVTEYGQPVPITTYKHIPLVVYEAMMFSEYAAKQESKPPPVPGQAPKPPTPEEAKESLAEEIRIAKLLILDPATMQPAYQDEEPKGDAKLFLKAVKTVNDHLVKSLPSQNTKPGKRKRTAGPK